MRYFDVFEEKAKAIKLLLSKESGKKKKGNCFDKDWADKHAASDRGSYDEKHEFQEGQDFEEVAIDGFLHIKLLSKIRLHGSGDDNEVNKSEEFDDKHYFVGSFCFTVVSGSCVIPSLVHLASHGIPGGICPGYLFALFVSLGISNVVLAC